MPRGDHEVFELRDLPLEGGATLRSARLAYATSGRSPRTAATPSSA